MYTYVYMCVRVCVCVCACVCVCVCVCACVCEYGCQGRSTGKFHQKIRVQLQGGLHTHGEDLAASTVAMGTPPGNFIRKLGSKSKGVCIRTDHTSTLIQLPTAFHRDFSFFSRIRRCCCSLFGGRGNVVSPGPRDPAWPPRPGWLFGPRKPGPGDPA